MSVIARLDSQVDEVLFGSLHAKRRAEVDEPIGTTNERQAQPVNHDSDVAIRAPKADASVETRETRNSPSTGEPNDLPVWML